MRTFVPLITRSPGFGFWPVTVSGGSPEKTCVIFGSSPAPASCVTAAVTLCPTTSGTSTCGLPVETTSVTVEPLPTFEPPPGFS